MLSVVVPVYNVENYLERCLESIINQTYKDLEIILVNDGSTDSSQKICEKYVEKDFRVKLINKKNGGLSSARNLGLEISKGDYIAFIDSDDYIDFEMYEKMMRKLLEKNADLVMCDVKVEFPTHNKIIETSDFLDVDIQLEKKHILKIYPTAWNKIYKKEIFIKNKIRFPEGLYYEDAEVNFKILTLINKITRVPNAYYHYVQRAGSITKSNSRFKMLDIYIIFENIKKFLIEEKKYEVYKKIYDYVYTRSTMVVLLYAFNFKDNKEKKKYIEFGYKKFQESNIKINEYFSIYEKILYYLSKMKILHLGSHINELRLKIKNRKI